MSGLRLELVLDAAVDESLRAASDLYRIYMSVEQLKPLTWSFCPVTGLDRIAPLEVSFDGCQSATLCKLWRFPAFVFSPWATIGSFARVSVVGVASGFLHLHKFMLDKGY
eukprot:1718915-Amphidinium_carterae.1